MHLLVRRPEQRLAVEPQGGEGSGLDDGRVVAPPHRHRRRRRGRGGSGAPRGPPARPAHRTACPARADSSTPTMMLSLRRVFISISSRGRRRSRPPPGSAHRSGRGRAEGVRGSRTMVPPLPLPTTGRTSTGARPCATGPHSHPCPGAAAGSGSTAGWLSTCWCRGPGTSCPCPTASTPCTPRRSPTPGSRRTTRSVARRHKLVPGSTAVVIGVGGLGHLAVQVLQRHVRGAGSWPSTPGTPRATSRSGAAPTWSLAPGPEAAA